MTDEVTTTDTELIENLTMLAGLEIPCEHLAKLLTGTWKLENRTEKDFGPPGCVDNNCTGLVPKYAWARVECKRIVQNRNRQWLFCHRGQKHSPNCPGYRPLTPAEARVRLDYLLRLYAMKIEPPHVGWKTGIPPWKAKCHDSIDWHYGDSPTDAAINALVSLGREK